ncbi:MAG: anti-sigma factor domain-containing protein [Solirubrobacteraceae bacterium]
MNESEHNVVFENLGAYALGALPDGERSMVATHLESCPVCAEDAQSLQRAATHLVDVIPEIEPSPDLRNRIMAVVEPEAAMLRAVSGRREPAPRPRRTIAMPVLLRWTATAAALLVIGGVAGTTVFEGSGGGDTRTLAADVGRGHAWVEVSDDKAHLVVDGMAQPARGKVYELWIQSGDAAPRPASDDLSRAVFMVGSGRVEIPARLQDGDRVMVTEEEPGGSRIPTAAPVVITSRV